MPRADYEDNKTLAFGSISGSWAKLGSPTSNTIRMLIGANGTDGDLYLGWSDDPSDPDTEPTKNGPVILAGTSLVVDVTANMEAQGEDAYVVSKGTQFWIKQITAPTQKSVYLSCWH